MEQRWFAPNETQVDIIPASDAALAADELIWSSGFRMNLAGFGLAFQLGERVALGAEVAVLVAPLSVLVILKMAAYLDRPAEREHDLDDLAEILEYGVRPDDEERYTDDVHDLGLSYEQAGAFVLGRRVAAVAGAGEKRLVGDFVRRSLDPDARQQVLHLLASRGPVGWNRDVEQARPRMMAFDAGFQGSTSSTP
jgi:predicted nucleotidyltransferase